MSYEDEMGLQANKDNTDWFSRPHESNKLAEEVQDENARYFAEQKVEEPIEEVEPGVRKVVESQFDEVYDPRTPEEIAKEIVDREEAAAIERAKNQKPEDTASWFFQMIWPRYLERVARLSNKEAKRVLEALVQWPLIDERPTFSSTEGKEAFSLGSRLIDAKTIMRDVVELEKLAEIAAKGEAERLAKENNEGTIPGTNFTVGQSFELTKEGIVETTENGTETTDQVLPE